MSAFELKLSLSLPKIETFELVVLPIFNASNLSGIFALFTRV